MTTGKSRSLGCARDDKWEVVVAAKLSVARVSRNEQKSCSVGILFLAAWQSWVLYLLSVCKGPLSQRRWRSPEGTQS